MSKNQNLQTNFTVVISTYNRKKELIRCLDSIYKQKSDLNLEVIVVDDATPISYEKEVINLFPNIKFISQKENKGPGEARNRGIIEAENNYVVIMDDDDVFVNGAFDKIIKVIDDSEISNYPKFSFLISNAQVTSDESLYIYSFDEIIKGKISGDTCQLINKKIWMKEGYMFPNSRIGAESLLWYRIAIDYGYPVVNEVIVNLMEDAGGRLTDFSNQIEKASLFARYQIDIINNFGVEIRKTGNLPFLVVKYKGAIIYSLLAGNKTQAKSLLKELKNYNLKNYWLFKLLLLFNYKIISKLLMKYRKFSKYKSSK